MMWEKHPNPLYHTFHTKQILPRIEMFSSNHKNILDKKLAKIAGIEEITCYKKYQLSFSIGSMFNNVDDLARIKKEVEDAVSLYFNLPLQAREEQ